MGLVKALEKQASSRQERKLANQLEKIALDLEKKAALLARLPFCLLLVGLRPQQPGEGEKKKTGLENTQI